MLEINVELTFETPLNIGSGAQVGTLADRAMIKNRDGWPYIPATAFKGQLRHAVEQVAGGMGQPVCDTHQRMCRDPEQSCPVCAIFGSPWIPGRLRFVNLELTGPPELMEALEVIRKGKGTPATTWRYGVALSRHRRVAEDALLFTTELFEPGVPLTFGGTLSGSLGKRDAAWIIAGLRMLPAMGRAKSAGLGRLSSRATVRLDGQPLEDAQLRAALEEVGP